MSEFVKTKIKSESANYQRIKDETIKLVREDAFSSSVQMELLMDKLVDNIYGQNTDANKIKEHIDNVYYHIGKIQGSLNHL